MPGMRKKNDDQANDIHGFREIRKNFTGVFEGENVKALIEEGRM